MRMKINTKSLQANTRSNISEQALWLFFDSSILKATASPGGVQSIVVVCMSVCLSVLGSHNLKTTRPNFTKCFMRVAYGRGSVLL